MITDYHVAVRVLWHCVTCWRRGDLLLQTLPENSNNYPLIRTQILTTLEVTKSKCECDNSAIRLSFVKKYKQQ